MNLGNNVNDPTSHAETSAIREVCKKLKSTKLEGATPYDSLEPCIMCFSAAYWSGITKIVFTTRKNKVNKDYYEGMQSLQELNSGNNRKMELAYIPELEEEALAVVKRWEKQNVSRLL